MIALYKGKSEKLINLNFRPLKKFLLHGSSLPQPLDGPMSAQHLVCYEGVLVFYPPLAHISFKDFTLQTPLNNRLSVYKPH